MQAVASKAVIIIQPLTSALADPPQLADTLAMVSM
jgi:hypothetical protein